MILSRVQLISFTNQLKFRQVNGILFNSLPGLDLSSPLLIRNPARLMRSSSSFFPLSKKLSSNRYESLLFFSTSVDPSIKNPSSHSEHSNDSNSNHGNHTDNQPPSFLAKSLRLYFIFLFANWLSNLMIHPKQRLDYGFLNPYLPSPRPVHNLWYGTRTEHLFLIPLFLTVSDLSWQRFFAACRLPPISLRATPLLWMAHLYVFTWSAVFLFFVQQALLHPLPDAHTDRVSLVTSKLWTLTAAMGLQWHVGHVEEALRRLTHGAGGIVGWCCAVLASSTAFFGAKALGFNDIGTSGLSPYEQVLNRTLESE